MATGEWDGRPVDAMDGVMFAPDEAYLVLGTFTDDGGTTSDYTGQAIYYRSLRATRRPTLLSAYDYLWRWDTDWFWCSRRVRRAATRWSAACGRPATAAATSTTGSCGSSTATASPRGSTAGAAAGARARRAGRRDPARAHRRVPALVRRARPDVAGVAVPAAAARAAGPGSLAGRSTHPAARTSTSASGAPCRSRRAATATSTGPSRQAVTDAGRAQDAVLRRVLRPGDVRPALRRRDVPRGEGSLRPGPPAHRSLREGGGTTMTTTTGSDRRPRRPWRMWCHAVTDGEPTGPHHRVRRQRDRPGRRGRSPLHVASERGLSYLLTAPGELGMARAYVAGDLALQRRAPGRPVRGAARCSRQPPAAPPVADARRSRSSAGSAGSGCGPPPPPPEEAPPPWRRAIAGTAPLARAGTRGAIQHHYDVSNAFYENVLGPSMTYTCAVYHDARRTRWRRRRRRSTTWSPASSALEPGMRLLDVGCGWGGMVRHAAREHGVRALGVTLSPRAGRVGAARRSSGRASATSPRCGTWTTATRPPSTSTRSARSA